MRRKSIYSGGDVRLTTLANGAVTHAGAHEKLSETLYTQPIVDSAAPGVTVFGGDFANVTLLEGPDGLVVYDTGEALSDGEQALAQIRKLSSKPIVAVIYSHSHYVRGTSAMVGDGEGVTIIGHPRLNGNLALGASGSLFPETAPLQISRTLQQFDHYASASGPDAPAGAAQKFGRSGFLPVNTPVEDGQRLTVAGIEMQFFTRYGSDTDDCVTVYLPKSGVVLNNMLWPWLPNIYTLRGSLFRDPRDWREGLKVIRALEPSVLVCTHARTIKGKAQIGAVLDDVIDGLSALLDQTLRGILRGLGPDELRDFVRLPRALADVPYLAETYGEVSHFGPYLYNAALGWFDGDAATINPLPPLEQATRLVAAMGGRDTVFAQATAAFADREYAWAAQLVGYLARIDPNDPAARALKADILQRLGHITPAHTVRSWYLAQARALRGEVKIPRLTFANTRVLAHAPPAETMDQFRVRIDPDLAGAMDCVVSLSITDMGTTHAWHLRRGVVEFIADVTRCRRAPDLVLATDYENWLRYFSCKRSLTDFVDTITIDRGTRDAAHSFFKMFDDHTRA